MADDPPITDLLSQWKSGDMDASRQIVEHFWRAANEVALRRLSPRIRHMVGGSDVANTVFRHALKYVADPKSNVEDSDDFWVVLVVFTRRKAATMAKRATAAKRGVDRTVAFTADVSKIDDQKSPLEKLIAEELGQRASELLAEEPDERKQMIARLSIFEGYSAAEIQEALAKEFPEKKPKSLRSIQETAKAIRGRLKKELLKEEDDG